MLGRTAESLFWMSRQMERAENMARLAEAGFRISLTPDTGDGHGEEWRSTLTSAGVLDSFLAKHGDGVVRQGDRLHPVRRGQPVLGPLVPEGGAHQCALRAHQDHPRHVGGAELHLAHLRRRSSPAEITGGAAAGAARLDPRARVALPRRAARHDPARRHLLLQPARRLRRARRQHRAHPRREIFHPAAEQPGDRRRRSTPINGRRSCARSRRTAPTGTSSTRTTGPGTSPTS